MSANVKAALWMIGAIFSFTSMAIAGRAIRDDYDTFEIMFFRSVIGFFLVLACAYQFKTINQIHTRHIGLHTLRNMAHFAGQNLWFFALPIIPLAQLFALEFTSPLWVLILAAIFLNEKMTGKQILYAAVGFIGVLIVSRPEFGTLDIGIVTAALAALFFAITAIATRRLTQLVSITNILFYLTLLQMIFGLITSLWDGVLSWPTLTALPWFVVIAIAGLLAHFCMTTALTLAPASIVMPVDFARLPIIALVGVLFYNEALDAFILLGAAMIILANYLNIRTTGKQVAKK